MIELALEYEIETNIPELVGEIYPTNAPKSHEKPCLVYMRTKTDKVKTLEGYTGEQALSFMFSVIVKRYENMIALRDNIEALLLSMPKRTIGLEENIFIEDIDIEDINETYEFELGANRGIIIFTIYY
nr:hypothetical protein [Sedimentibacter sp.]